MVTNCVEAVCTTLLSCALRAWRLVGEILIGFSAYEPYVGFHGSVRDNTLMPITGVDLRALVVRGKFVFVAQIGSPQREGSTYGTGETSRGSGLLSKREDPTYSEVLRRLSMKCETTQRRPVLIWTFSSEVSQSTEDMYRRFITYLLFVSCLFVSFNVLTPSIFNSHMSVQASHPRWTSTTQIPVRLCIHSFCTQCQIPAEVD